ncbi:MAG: adenosine kinase [Alloprevotella sp.]|nr:adenosine kinase [Alloprevotella sp.]
MKRVLGIGNALSDALIKVTDDELRALGLPKGSTQFTDLSGYHKAYAHLSPRIEKWASGGSSGNTIQALGRLGASPGFIGKVGDDAPGHAYIDNCVRHGIQTHFLTDDLPSGICLSLVSPDGQRTMFDYLGAAANMQAEELDARWFSAYDVLHLEGYLAQNHDLILRAVRLAKEAGLKISLDFGNYNIVAGDHDFFVRLLEDVDIIFANEDEAAAFTRLSDPTVSLKVLSNICEVAVVKVGADGAWAKRGEEICHVDAVKVDHVLDTTGAGDSFAAGFLWALNRGESLRDCLSRGAMLASKVIQTMGASPSETAWEELRPYFV